MHEKLPTPLSRGVEIQRSMVEEVCRQAMKRYTELTPLSDLIEERISAALSREATEESLAELAGLFEKKRELQEIEHALEDMILRTLDRQDELQTRLEEIEARISGVRSVGPSRRP